MTRYIVAYKTTVSCCNGWNLNLSQKQTQILELNPTYIQNIDFPSGKTIFAWVKWHIRPDKNHKFMP